MFLRDIDSLDEHALVIDDLEHSASPSFILAGDYNHFIAFS